MTFSRHGDATLTVEIHDGLIEYVLELDHLLRGDGSPDHIKLRITDQQARDARLCFADVFPYTEAAVLGSEVHGHDNGIPVRTLTGQKSCGCFVTDVCDCYPAGRTTW
jgi:hypothetical protein